IIMVLSALKKVDRHYERTIESMTAVPKPRLPRNIKPLIKSQSFSLLLATFTSIFLLSASMQWKDNPSPLLGLVGIMLGTFTFGFTRVRKVPSLLISVLMSVSLFSFLYVDPAVLGYGWFTLAAGFGSGMSLSELSWNGSFTVKIRRSKIGLFVFFLVFLSLVAGALSNEIRYLVEDNKQYLVIGYAWLILMVVCTLPALMNKNLLERIKKTGIKLATVMFTRPGKSGRGRKSGKGRKIMKARSAVLIVACIMPLFFGILTVKSNFQVTVNFPSQVYDVHGNPITRITLRPTSAKIVLKSPHPVGTIHDELIRQGKSVRLGGYYYGYGNDISGSQVIDWIGNNADVFSLGTCGSLTKPENITSIRNINPNVKFYYMAFATTLYEDEFSSFSDPDWGNSHYPHVKFNATMYDWTLKLSNGSEATGVRRDSISSKAHLMDLGRMEWADYFAWIYENRVNQFHADGVAIDEIMWRSYWNTEIENLANYSSVEEVTATCYQWLERIDQHISSEIITQAFWDEAQEYQQGVWGELAFKSGSAPEPGKPNRQAGPYGSPTSNEQGGVFYETMNWQEVVNNAYNISSRNESYIWAAWYESGDVEGLEYAIGTYLMAKPNNCKSLVFQPHPGYYPQDGIVGYAVQTTKEEVEAYPEYFNLELGDALGTMVEVNGIGGKVWMREFENGYIYCNPNLASLDGF
ncbi:MAG: hypothetical protein ACTSUE_02305, partial [Promethearchaeota archaeon]